MDTRTGRIYSPEELREMMQPKTAGSVETPPVDMQFIREMKIPPTPRQLARRKVGRNDPCPCGSQKKFKRCCLDSQA